MNDRNIQGIEATEVGAEVSTTYPEPFRAEVAGRSKRALGDHFGLQNFGVNLVELAPGAWSAQRHWHTHEDEFVYVVAGEITLITDAGRQVLTSGMVVGFAAGREDGHHLVNESTAAASFLVVGDRRVEDEAHYPDIDLALKRDGKGEGIFTRKDGIRY